MSRKSELAKNSWGGSCEVWGGTFPPPKGAWIKPCIPTSTHTAYSPSKAAQITNKQNDEKSSKTKHFALYCNSCLCEVFFIAMRYCAVPNQHKRRPHSAQYLVSPSVRPYVTHKLYSKYNIVPLLRTRVNINIETVSGPCNTCF